MMRHETYDRHRSIGGRPDCRRTDCRRPLRSGISILCPTFALSTELASAQPAGSHYDGSFGGSHGRVGIAVAECPRSGQPYRP